MLAKAKALAKAKVKHIYSYRHHLQSSLTIVKIFLQYRPLVETSKPVKLQSNEEMVAMLAEVM
jgi:hypothetical protein